MASKDRFGQSSKPPMNRPPGAMTIDVEDWFHILDSPASPTIETWNSLESRIEPNVELMLDIFEQTGTRATLFWLGWIAERHQSLVRRCQEAGHEIASHGYAHLLPYQVGPKAFNTDLVRAKNILEEITGEAVFGFRAPGFGITDDTCWAFEVIRESGYEYDSSVFPAARGHGGLLRSPVGPYVIETKSGPLLQCPMSVAEVAGWRLALFGGGYLRLAPKWLIAWGIENLRKSGKPLIVYVHPREIDPTHPRLAVSVKRRFKSYVNLKSTMGKIEWLCRRYRPGTMREMITQLGQVTKTISFD